VRPPGPIRDKKIRCVLAHDHVLLRQGVRRLLEDAGDIAVEAETGNAAETLRVVAERRPDMVILDPLLDGHDSELFLNAITRESPNSKVLFLGADARTDSAGVAGLPNRTTKETSARELIHAVRNAHTSDARVGQENPRKGVAEWPANESVPRKRSLTVRERQVLKLLAEGHTVRSVAGVLGLSIKTVDAHKFNLMRKLGIHNKAELVMWAIQKRVVKLPVNL
jgi:two-component system, NarL family, response regulator NreC